MHNFGCPADLIYMASQGFGCFVKITCSDNKNGSWGFVILRGCFVFIALRNADFPSRAGLCCRPGCACRGQAQPAGRGTCLSGRLGFVNSMTFTPDRQAPPPGGRPPFGEFVKLSTTASQIRLTPGTCRAHRLRRCARRAARFARRITLASRASHPPTRLAVASEASVMPEPKARAKPRRGGEADEERQAERTAML